MSTQLPENCKALAHELAVNGPIHISQIPEIDHPSTGLGQTALNQLIALGVAHHITVKGKKGFIASSHINPFVNQG